MKNIWSLILVFAICFTTMVVTPAEVYANTSGFTGWFESLPALAEQTLTNIQANTTINNSDYTYFYDYPGQPYRRFGTEPGSFKISSVQSWDETGGGDRKGYGILKLDKVDDIYGENQGSYVYDVDFNLVLTGTDNLAPITTAGNRKAHCVYLGFFGGTETESGSASYSVINFYRDKIIESWERDNNDKVDIASFDGDGLTDGKYNIKYEYVTGASASQARVNVVLTKYKADGATLESAPLVSVSNRKLKHMLAESKETYSEVSKASLGWLEAGVRTPYTGSSIEITRANFGKSVSEVVLNNNTAELSIGKTKQLTASVVPSDAVSTNIIWSSSAADVVSVDGNGLITAISRGTAVITAISEIGAKTATCTVTVNEPPFGSWFAALPELNNKTLSDIQANTKVNNSKYAKFYEYSGQPYRRFSTAPGSFKISSIQSWDETGGSDRKAYGILKLAEIDDIYGVNCGKYIYDVDFNLMLTGEENLAPITTAGNRKSHCVYLGFFGGTETESSSASYSVINLYRDKAIESWERDNNDKVDIASFDGDGLTDGKYNIKYEYVTGQSASQARVNIVLTRYKEDGITLENIPLISVSNRKLKHMLAESKEAYSEVSKASLGWLEVGVRTPYTGSSIEITRANFGKNDPELYISQATLYDGEKNEENRIFSLTNGKTYSKIYADIFLEKLNNTPQNKKVTATLAVYNGNRLEQIFTKKCDFDKQNNYICDFEIGSFKATENSAVKIFVWDENLKPESTAQVFTIGTDENLAKRDMALIKSKIATNIYSSSIDVSETVALLSNGKFSDLTYDSAENCLKALSRATDMLKAYFSKGNKSYLDATLKTQIASVLTDWAQNDYQSSNWWYNDIGTPQTLAVTFVYPLDEIIDSATKTALINIAKRGIPEINESNIHKTKDASGANLTDKLIIALKIAVLTENKEGLETVSALLDNELQRFPQASAETINGYVAGNVPSINIAEYEGIAPDYSFKQHGILYSGGYGKAFAGGVASLLEYLRDTQYMPSERALNVYADFILDGYAPMFKGDGYDFSIMGRYISRSNFDNSIKYNTADAVRTLIKYSQINRRTELMDLYENRIYDKDNGATMARHYWSSDYTILHRPEFFVSVKNLSNRNISTEFINGENRYGFYLSDGATAILKTGLEYKDIYPVWDWSRIPGTTTTYLSGSDVQIGSKNNVANNMYQNGVKSFVGGVSDGKYALSAMDYKHFYDGTYYYTAAKKAVFMFDDGFMALGAGITGNNWFKRVYTTLNQCNLNGEVAYSSNNSAISTLASGNSSSVNAKWVNHDGVSYIFPTAQSVTISNKAQTGSWSKINDGGTTDTISKNVFTAYLDHGTSPSNKSYSYTVLPSATIEETKVYAENPDMILVANTTETQSVWSKKANMLGAVFYSANKTVSVGSEITGLSGNLTLKTSAPCAVLLEKTQNGWQISVSDPTNGDIANVTVTVNGTEHNITLPVGIDKGKTVTVQI